MEPPEIHGDVRTLLHAEVQGRPSGERRNSPIFVPVVKSPLKLVRRGRRKRRKQQFAILVLALLLISAFGYAFVVEHDRERTLTRETQ